MISIKLCACFTYYNEYITFKLSIIIYKTVFEIQKIDDLALIIYKIVMVSFLFQKKLKKIKFFKKAFLLSKINIEIVLKMFFPTYPNVNIQFVEKKLV